MEWEGRGSENLWINLVVWQNQKRVSIVGMECEAKREKMWIGVEYEGREDVNTFNT